MVEGLPSEAFGADGANASVDGLGVGQGTGADRTPAIAFPVGDCRIQGVSGAGQDILLDLGGDVQHGEQSAVGNLAQVGAVCTLDVLSHWPPGPFCQS